MADWSIYKHNGSGGRGDLTSPENLAAAQEHKITMEIIIGNDKAPIPIEGYMKDAFTYSVAASYNKILDYSSQEGFTRFAKDLAQANSSLYSGYLSKKMFSPGNAYAKLELKFRVYDREDIIEICDILTTCCLPIIDKNNFMLNESAITVLGNFASNTGTMAKNLVSNTIDGGAGEATGGLVEDLMDNYTTRMPPHLNIWIGSYFKKSEMVITNLDFTFSKEFTKSKGKTYPTYADFNVSVESLYSMLGLGSGAHDRHKRVFGTGFHEKSGSRVTTITDTRLESNPVKTAVDQVKSVFNGGT